VIAVVVALVAWNVATQLLAARREARLLAAALARTPGEYVAMRKAEVTPALAKKRSQPREVSDVDPADLYPIGL
jgi:hypothetical protein